MPSISVGRSEVLALFRTWLEDRALVRVELRFRVLAAVFRARVTRVEDRRFWLMSDDTESELVLPVPEDAEFRFLDMREFPDVAGKFERMLMLLYPFKFDPDESDQIVFAEVIEHHGEA